jgi:hypothetical protein
MTLMTIPGALYIQLTEMSPFGMGGGTICKFHLMNFLNRGSWDFDNDRWYSPVGAFDWTATEYFEIMAEYSDLVGIHFYFDDIRVLDPKPRDRS